MSELKAFPFDGSHDYGLLPDSGMDLRDYFAAKAMQGWVSTFAAEDGDPEPYGVAKLAYQIADAMMAARGEHD